MTTPFPDQEAAAAGEHTAGGVRLLDETRRREIVSEAARRTGVDAGLLQALLDLERENPNLHAWGAKPALRRAAAALIDRDIKAREGGKTP